MTPRSIPQAYRDLYRGALLATYRATPAKYIIRATLRFSFRSGSAENFDPQAVENTVAFLQRAGQDTGTEHHILKHLLHVRYWQYNVKRDNKLITQQTERASRIRRENWAMYEATLAMFNNSLGTCLR